MVGSNEAGVAPPVNVVGISFERVSRPQAWSATFAIGKPVAFEASAETRDPRVHLDHNHAPVGRTPDVHVVTSINTRDPSVAFASEGHRPFNCKGRRQACGRLHARRDRQRHHWRWRRPASFAVDMHFVKIRALRSEKFPGASTTLTPR